MEAISTHETKKMKGVFKRTFEIELVLTDFSRTKQGKKNKEGKKGKLRKKYITTKKNEEES